MACHKVDGGGVWGRSAFGFGSLAIIIRARIKRTQVVEASAAASSHLEKHADEMHERGVWRGTLMLLALRPLIQLKKHFCLCQLTRMGQARGSA